MLKKALRTSWRVWVMSVLVVTFAANLNDVPNTEALWEFIAVVPMIFALLGFAIHLVVAKIAAIIESETAAML